MKVANWGKAAERVCRVLKRWKANSLKSGFSKWIVCTDYNRLKRVYSLRLLDRSVRIFAKGRVSTFFFVWSRKVHGKVELLRRRKDKLAFAERIVRGLHVRVCLSAWRTWLCEVKWSNDMKRGIKIVDDIVRR